MSSRAFKKEQSAEDQRLARHRNTIELRKNKTNEKLKKLRNIEETSSHPAATLQDVSRIPHLLQQMMSPDENVQEETTRDFRRLLSIEKNPPIKEVIDSGATRIFVTFLQKWHRPVLQFEALWALTNIASGTSEHTQHVVDCGATPIFVQLMQSPNDDVREQAVWALGNIAGDSPKLRDYVISLDGLNPLLQLLSNSGSRISMLRNGTWTLSNFCRGKPQPDMACVSLALPVLSHLMFCNDEEVLTDACWALSYLSDGTNERIQAVLDSGVIVRLVDLLSHQAPQVKTPALRTIGNIVTGDDHQTQAVVNSNALPSLLAILQDVRKTLRKEAAWTLSNITAGSRNQIQSVFDAQIIPVLIQMLATDDFDVKKECAWAISNATSGGDPAQIMYLVQFGCIPPLVALLDKHEVRIVVIALEGLENILKAGAKMPDAEGNNPYVQLIELAGGLEKIEELQKHENVKIFNMSGRILENYFGAVEEDDEDVTAGPVQTESGGFAFAPPSAGTGFMFQR